MWVSDAWTDYRLSDGADGEKLEVWGDMRYIRPDPQIIWDHKTFPKLWDNADGHYHRSPAGGGAWEFCNEAAREERIISYRGLKFIIKPTGFKHMGLFPEQAVNWDFMRGLIKDAGREIRVLNLFGYTGAATVACAGAGASVCHVDAAKGMVACAKRNAEINGLAGKDIRYIVDDAIKFTGREGRRGKKYDAVVMDPPTYGRGPDGELWKVEDELYGLIRACMDILSDTPLFFVINSYTGSMSHTTVKNLMLLTLCKKFGGSVTSDEIGLKFENSDMILPCGSATRWEKS